MNISKGHSETEIHSLFLLLRIIEVKLIWNWLLCNIWIIAIAFIVSKHPKSGGASIPKPILGKSHTSFRS